MSICTFIGGVNIKSFADNKSATVMLTDFVNVSDFVNR